MAVEPKRRPSIFPGPFHAPFMLPAVILAILLLAGGCARFGFGPPPLAENEKALVLGKYRAHLERLPACAGIEADVNLQYRSVLKDFAISGVLLAKSPSSLKFLGLSPLGQPLLLFSLHHGRFSFVDVHAEKGYTGSIRAEKVKEMLPIGKMADEGLYALLTGRPAIAAGDKSVVVYQDKQENYLISWPGEGEGGRRQVVFDMTEGKVVAFRVLDKDGRKLLAIGYDASREERCGVPVSLSISGSAVHGTIECLIEQVFAADLLPESTFQLKVPEGFSMQEVH